MADEKLSASRPVNKAKIYAAAFGIFLLVNFAVELCITLIENAAQQWLYPIFPFTRLALLIFTILAANYYIRRRLGKPKPKLWWRITKPILLILVVYGLIMGAWLSVLEADVDRARTEREKSMQDFPTLQAPNISR